MSLPVRGAWIEIYIWTNKTLSKFLSLPVRGAWIEMTVSAMFEKAKRTYPCGERGLK